MDATPAVRDTHGTEVLTAAWHPRGGRMEGEGGSRTVGGLGVRWMGGI